MSGSSSKLLGFSRLSSCCALPRRGAASHWMSRRISSSNSGFLLGFFSGKSYNNKKVLWVGLQSLPPISSPFLILSPPRSPSRRTTSSSLFLRSISASSTSNGSSTTSSTTGMCALKHSSWPGRRIKLVRFHLNSVIVEFLDLHSVIVVHTELSFVFWGFLSSCVCVLEFCRNKWGWLWVASSRNHGDCGCTTIAGALILTQERWNSVSAAAITATIGRICKARAQTGRVAHWSSLQWPQPDVSLFALPCALYTFPNPFLQKLQCCDLLHLPHSCNQHMKKHCGGVNVFYCSSF